MSESTEEVYKRANQYKPEGEDYLRILIEQCISVWNGQKRQLGKDKKDFENALEVTNNKIAEADYHLGQLKQIQIERGWTKIRVKNRKEKEPAQE